MHRPTIPLWVHRVPPRSLLEADVPQMSTTPPDALSLRCNPSRSCLESFTSTIPDSHNCQDLRQLFIEWSRMRGGDVATSEMTRSGFRQSSPRFYKGRRHPLQRGGGSTQGAPPPERASRANLFCSAWPRNQCCPLSQPPGHQGAICNKDYGDEEDI